MPRRDSRFRRAKHLFSPNRMPLSSSRYNRISRVHKTWNSVNGGEDVKKKTLKEIQKQSMVDRNIELRSSWKGAWLNAKLPSRPELVYKADASEPLISTSSLFSRCPRTESPPHLPFPHIRPVSLTSTPKILPRSLDLTRASTSSSKDFFFCPHFAHITTIHGACKASRRLVLACTGCMLHLFQAHIPLLFLSAVVASGIFLLSARASD